jgi:hypothetical protein
VSFSKLSILEVSLLAVLIEAAQKQAKVTFIAPGEIVKIRTGTARHIVKSTSDWTFPGSESYDVRDCALRITETSGLDVAYPIRDLMDSVAVGEFQIDRDAVKR